MTKISLDQFIKAPVPRGTTVDLSRDSAWICFNHNSITLDGEFTHEELKKIIEAFGETIKSNDGQTGRK